MIFNWSSGSLLVQVSSSGKKIETVLQSQLTKYSWKKKSRQGHLVWEFHFWVQDKTGPRSTLYYVNGERFVTETNLRQAPHVGYLHIELSMSKSNMYRIYYILAIKSYSEIIISRAIILSPEIVYCSENCSDLLWKKNEETFLIWLHCIIYSSRERSEQFLEQNNL